ncbi:protein STRICTOSIDINE SYNTHASE-LIKE 11-like [Tripterygium wilfordii]|uniref:protein STRICTOSIDINE SYNTHASE-LIKE 11-like n=1 Tax=Tripterygium wilfordii TaxID=458696 RepID=UPI0018F83ABB|nr:protein STRICTOSIDINE SYNTHASE-LIKE 11-like [Tripterygium wilfordii]
MRKPVVGINTTKYGYHDSLYISRMTFLAISRLFMLSFFTFVFPLLVTPALSAVVRIPLPPRVTGPESLAFEPTGTFYTGVTDGRILKFERSQGFLDFAIISPNRSKAVCDGVAEPQRLCGRPLGLGFYYLTKTLYVADAYYGLLSLGPRGRLATPIASSADGQSFVFCEGLDVDQQTGFVYFTDASAVYDIRNVEQAVLANDSTGRLLKYDPRTNQVTTLLRNLSGPGGVAVSKTGSFVLVSEFIANRTQKFWLTGPRANTAEVFVRHVRPDNIKRTLRGDFWIAAMMLKQPTQTLVPIRQLVSETGSVLRTVSLEAHYGNTSITEVLEFGVRLYFGSKLTNFIGVSTP